MLGADFAFNHSYTVWGDLSYIDEGMLVSYFNVYPNKNINASTPTRINAFANNRVNWKIYIKNEAGTVVDTIDVENEHEIHLNWTPEDHLPNGTYTIYADVVNKQGFKVTTSPKSVTVLQDGN